jgi:hypothetical protein
LADGADRPAAEVDISGLDGEDQNGAEDVSDRRAGYAAESRGFDPESGDEAYASNSPQVAISDSLRDLVRDYPFGIVLTAAFVGFLLGRR